LRQEVTGGALELLQQGQSVGDWRWLKREVSSRKRIDEVFGALLEEKLHRIVFDGFAASLDKDPEIDEDGVFYPFIEGELSNTPKMPDEDIRELLVMLEERRRSYFGNVATLVSGLVGGLLGAAVGALLTFKLAGDGAKIISPASPKPAIASTPSLSPDSSVSKEPRNDSAGQHEQKADQ
jgi:hypothetical protein